MNLAAAKRKLEELEAERESLMKLGLVTNSVWAARKRGGPVHYWTVDGGGQWRRLCHPVIGYTREMLGQSRSPSRVRRACRNCRSLRLHVGNVVTAS